MFKLLKREKRAGNREAPPSAIADAKALKIASSILRVQKRIAERLNERFARLSAKQKKILMLSMGGIFGLYCLYVLLAAIIN